MVQKTITRFKKLWPFLIVFILSWWATKPLFHSGFFPMHDDEQIARLFVLDQAIKAGQIPPRWVDELGFGFGYPFYNFYPPFVYYLGEVFYLLGFSLIGSIKLVIFLGFVLSGFFIYLLAKEFFGFAPGVVAAVFYLYAPYHALDIYVRGALAEFFTFVWVPLVFLGFYRLAKKSGFENFLLASLSLALLILTHNLIFIAFLPIFFFYLLFLWFTFRKKESILLFAGSIIFSLTLTSYFWLPAFFEKKFTLVDEILTRELANYKLHFVYLRQFWHSPWGYGGSIFGLEDGISFEVGKFHLVFAFLAGLLGLHLLLKKKNLQTLFLTSYFLLFTFSLFMASFHSQFIWDKIKLLWYLQFPWRYLLFACLFSSFLAGGFFFYLQKKVKGSFLRYLIFILIVFLVILFNKDYFQPAKYLQVADQDYLGEDIRWRVSKMSFEYVPKGIATYLSKIGTTQVKIEKEEIPQKPYQIKGKIKVKEAKILPHQKKFLVEGKGGDLMINTYYFPGWEVKIDGRKVKVDDNNKFKLMMVKIPQGTHLVEAEFKNTPVRVLGNSLTALGLLLLLVLKFLPWRKGDLKFW